MLEVNVSGMSCGHCVKAVTQAVQELNSEAVVDIDLSSGKVNITGVSDMAAVSHAIEEAGFEVTGINATGA
ncbi:heavy-metal-associated domain-containing protein [Nitrincola alkalilacustris]|uniref:heavy-metal-associated domain-containing protein n=1 Tax=Nitrincola alkalilacustris TaxID=1571224 RepID=UPI00124CF2FB|nr:cation transporter [Nitrincola alkalilacustris]